MFKNLLEQNCDLFAYSDIDLGFTNKVKMRIDTQDHPPIRQKAYRTPFLERPKVEAQIQDMLNSNIIRPSTSPWSSPIVIVPKKDGTRRMCVDFRKLNNITSTKNSYPLPDIQDILSCLKGAKVYSCIDLKSGYWQIKMAEEDRPKTAFICHKGLFEFNIMPFGLCSAPPIFQELMNLVLGDAINNFAFVYLDDIIVFSNSYEEHLEHLQIIFNRLRSANLRIKPSKCAFALEEVEFLGHRVSASGIKPDPNKVAVIKELQPPTNIKQVRSFMGMIGYYRRFISNFSNICAPLTALTRKHAKFLWTKQCDSSFQILKDILCTAPILAHPDFSKPYKLYTDASLFAVGGVLTQEFSEGERVIQYVSKQLSLGQQKWPTIEREAYAIVHSVNKLRQYLLGSKFTVITDHKPLRSLFTAEMKNARIQRWAIMLSEYGCDIQYQSGKTNIPADMLSRIPKSTIEDEVFVLDNSEPTFKTAAKEDPQPNEDSPPLVLPDDELKATLLQDDKFINFQRQDPSLHQYFTNLEEGVESNNFVLQEGRLYHISSPVKKDKDEHLQLVLPRDIAAKVVRDFHSSPYGGGHLSVEKTYDKIRRRFFWPSMYKDLVQYIDACDLCQARRPKRPIAPLQDMPMPQWAFEMIAIDTCGPFPETHRGNKYLITVIDHLTCWPEAFSVPNKTAETVARVLLEEIIPRHSCPKYILSDRGTEFVNAVIGLITEKMGMVHLKTSPYHPQTNGKVERLHRMINDSLAKYTHQQPLSWDLFVPSVMMSYRTSVHDTTKYSPFFLLYGRDPVLPFDTLLQPRRRYLGDDYVPTMLERLHLAYSDVRENTITARERNKELRGRRAEMRSFEPGDPVFYYTPVIGAHESSKLTLHWKPHYRVIEKKSPVLYVIHNQVTGVTKTVHVNHLKLANPTEVWDKPWNGLTTYESRHKMTTEVPERREQPVRGATLATRYGGQDEQDCDLQSPASTVNRVQPQHHNAKVQSQHHETERVPPILLRRQSAARNIWSQVPRTPVEPQVPHLVIRKRTAPSQEWEIKRPRIDADDDKQMENASMHTDKAAVPVGILPTGNDNAHMQTETIHMDTCNQPESHVSPTEFIRFLRTLRLM